MTKALERGTIDSHHCGRVQLLVPTWPYARLRFKVPSPPYPKQPSGAYLFNGMHMEKFQTGASDPPPQNNETRRLDAATGKPMFRSLVAKIEDFGDSLDIPYRNYPRTKDIRER